MDADLVYIQEINRLKCAYINNTCMEKNIYFMRKLATLTSVLIY